MVHRLRSAAAYAVFCALVAVAGPPALLASRLARRPGPVLAVGRFAAAWLRRLLGIRLQAEGLERVVADRPSVYAINHRSNVDVVAFEALYPKCPRLRGVYKAELGRIPVLGPALRLAGFVPVERVDRVRAFEAVDNAAQRLTAGDSILVAPEGTRAPADQLLPLKKGAFVMAIKAQAPVVPVALFGAADVMPRGRWWAAPGLVRVVVGEPLPSAGLSLEDRDRLASAFRDSLERLLRP